MKTLNKHQLIAVVAGLGFLAYVLFSGQIMSFFSGTNNIQNTNTPMQTPTTGLMAEEVVVGTGLEVAAGDTLTVHYVGTLPDGKIFDSSVERNEPFSFTLGVGSVIRGWDEGLAGMRVGGKRILTVPPEFGYGSQAVGPIPANSTLLFAVELLDVKKPASQ